MHIIIVHRNFPGQFVHICKALRNRGDYITSIGANIKGQSLSDRHYKYQIRRGNGRDTQELTLETETKFIRAEGVVETAKMLKQNSYRPDLIIGHPGWGETIFLKTVWPEVPQIHYLEYFYGVGGTDHDF